MMPYPGNNTNYNDPIKVAAGDFNRDGKDEVAIAIEKKLYICKADMNAMEILSSKTNFSTSIGDIEALDTNGDGFLELVVTVDSINMTSTSASLMIYSGTNLSQPTYSKNLSLGDVRFKSASVDIGDLLGDGGKTIALFLNFQHIKSSQKRFFC